MRLMPRIFDDADPSNWRDALYWLCFTLIGGLAPTWCGYVTLKLLSRNFTFNDFTRHGEFALYAAAIVAPALHALARDLKVPGFKGRQLLQLLSVIFMALAVCVYGAVSAAYTNNSLSQDINTGLLEYGTLGLFLFSALLAFCVTLLDYSRLSSDPRAVLDGQRDELNREFNQLQRQDPQ